MKTLSIQEIRDLDRKAIESGIDSFELMQTAGEGVATAIQQLASNHQLIDVPILFLAGCGNNGGDAFVAATVLHREEWTVECWIAGLEEKLKGDALTAFKKMKKAGVPFQFIPDPNDWKQRGVYGVDAEMIVDGLLGTGFSGEPRSPIAEAIAFVQQAVNQALIISIDVPSAWSIPADLTLSMAFPKTDLLLPEYINMVGNLEIIDIGIPSEISNALKPVSDLEFIHPTDLRPLFVPRKRDAHKGTFGHLLAVGGSKGFSGAITLALRAALRSGVGLVSAFVPSTIHSIVATAVPEAMVHDQFPEKTFSATLLGPGMGVTKTTQKLVLDELARPEKTPLVLDADALCVLADKIEKISDSKRPVVLTPHPGEFAKLFGLRVSDVQEDRIGLVKMASERLGATIVLKGAGTLVASPKKPIAVNLTGNPGLATGGSGDVLAGLLAGLLAQGFSIYPATCAAVWLHGRAGDFAAAEKSQQTLLPTDLIEKFSDVFRELSCR